MAIDLCLEKLSDEMSEGTVSRWLKAEGEPVASGEPLVEVETEKVIVEVESPRQGVLLEILASEQEVVPVGGTLARIGDAAEFKARAPEVKPSTPKSTGIRVDSTGRGFPETGSQRQNVVPMVPPVSTSPALAQARSSAKANPLPGGADPHSMPRAVTPLARRVAVSLGIDLKGMEGSGIGGKIILADLQPYVGDSLAPGLVGLPANGGDMRGNGVAEDNFEEVTPSALKRTMARRMAEAKGTIPHFYMSTEIDVTDLLALRKRLNRGQEERLTVNDFLIKGAAAALGKVPEVNAVFVNGAVRRYRAAHVGFAVAGQEGLVTPVIRDCGIKSLGAISREAKDLIARAGERKLRPGELEGGTFTISNLGMRDVSEFAAIINPPQVAILAVARPMEKPVAQNGWVVVRSVLLATVSADHRVLDGITVAGFLEALKAILQDPERVLLR